MWLKITCSGFALVIKEASFIFHLVLYEKLGLYFFDLFKSWKSINLDDFFQQDRKFYKKDYIVSYLLLVYLYMHWERYKRDFKKTFHGLESARNIGKFYTQRRQLLPDISPVCSLKKIDLIVNNSSEETWHHCWAFFLTCFYKFF